MSKQTFADAVVIIAEYVARKAVTKASNWSRMQPKEPDDIGHWFLEQNSNAK